MHRYRWAHGLAIFVVCDRNGTRRRGKPLSEAHVSRRALGILAVSGSTCRIPPRRCAIDVLDELKQGMGLRFGHGVVGFVRLIPLREIDVDSLMNFLECLIKPNRCADLLTWQPEAICLCCFWGTRASEKT